MASSAGVAVAQTLRTRQSLLRFASINRCSCWNDDVAWRRWKRIAVCEKEMMASANDAVGRTSWHLRVVFASMTTCEASIIHERRTIHVPGTYYSLQVSVSGALLLAGMNNNPPS